MPVTAHRPHFRCLASARSLRSLRDVDMASQPPAPVPPVAGPSTLKRPIGALDGEDSDGDDLASAGPALTPIAPVKATVTARDGKPHFTVTTTDGAPGVEATLQDLQDGQPGQKPPVRWKWPSASPLPASVSAAG